MCSARPLPADQAASASGPFVDLAGEFQPERFIDVALPGVHDAGRPYVDWFFGGPAEARAALQSWMARPSSEVFVGRAVLLRTQEDFIGGFIALSGAELVPCRQADVVAALRLIGPAGRSGRVERVKLSGELFPPVARDEFYLSKIWVAPGARGAGHGATLLRHYLNSGARRDFTRFRLDVWSRNRVARQLYQQFGFKVLQESTSEGAAMGYTSMAAGPWPLGTDG